MKIEQVRFWSSVEQTVRGPTRDCKQVHIRSRTALIFVCLFGSFYGAVMGCYGWLSGGRAFSENILQVLFAAGKVPLLLTATFLISLPSFFVINSLLGLRRDFAESLKCIISGQATLSIILASFAPLTLMYYISTPHSSPAYRLAIVINAAMIGMASLSSQIALRRSYQPLMSRNRLHRWMLWCWSLVYAFVGIQMGWVLRPFVGQVNSKITFFRNETWGNAYLKIFELFQSIIQ